MTGTEGPFRIPKDLIAISGSLVAGVWIVEISVEGGMRRSVVAAALIGMMAAAAPPATAQHTAPSGATSSGSAVPSGGGSSSGGGSGSSGGSSSSSGGSSDSGSSSGRQRGSAPVSGRAVPRTGQSGGGGPITIGFGGFYPWGYASGAGIGIYDGFYGGFYGAYDPWYGFAPIYAPSSSYGHDESGSIRLRVKPSNADVYVDGYYAGVVDDFDGPFQRLHLEPGPHHVEIRAADFTTLSVDVWITEGLTINYRGELGNK